MGPLRPRRLRDVAPRNAAIQYLTCHSQYTPFLRTTITVGISAALPGPTLYHEPAGGGDGERDFCHTFPALPAALPGPACSMGGEAVVWALPYCLPAYLYYHLYLPCHRSPFTACRDRYAPLPTPPLRTTLPASNAWWHAHCCRTTARATHAAHALRAHTRAVRAERNLPYQAATRTGKHPCGEAGKTTHRAGNRLAFYNSWRRKRRDITLYTATCLPLLHCSAATGNTDKTPDVLTLYLTAPPYYLCNVAFHLHGGTQTA